MSYFWLYFKSDEGHVRHTFLLEEVSPEAALARVATIDCGELWAEVWSEEGLVGRSRREQKLAQPA